MDLGGRAAGVDAMDKVIVERGEDVVALLQGFFVLEGVGFPIPDADAVKSHVGFQHKQEDVVRPRGELFIDGPDFGGVESACPLVGHGGKEITVDDDGGTAFEGGHNERLHVVAAILVEEIKFVLWG